MQALHQDWYNTMTAIGNAMGIAIIGSIFFGLIGTGASPTTFVGSYTDLRTLKKRGNYTNIVYFTSIPMSSS
jgi:hypothetical protein